MQNHVWAKIFGWAQFGLSLFGQVGQTFSTSGAPHGVMNWVALIGSLATAVGVHAASSTDGNH